MLVGKKISNKIDYDKLKDLGFIFGGLPTTSSASTAPSTSTSEPVIESGPIAPKKYFHFIKRKEMAIRITLLFIQAKDKTSL